MDYPYSLGLFGLKVNIALGQYHKCILLSVLYEHKPFVIILPDRVGQALSESMATSYVPEVNLL